MRAVHLRTEYLKNPIGIDIRKPRFFWQCEGGKKQTAYRITARRLAVGGMKSDAASRMKMPGLSGIPEKYLRHP